MFLPPDLSFLFTMSGHQDVVGRLHLALADVRAAAQLTAAGQRALGLRSLQPLAAVYQREALGLRKQTP